jgi:DNA-binding MarR family transcriptional regulator
MGCTCLHLRRASRRVTQIYDHELEASGLTINQFGLLAYLYGASFGTVGGLPIGALADRIGAAPTTLNRTLKPLVAKGLVRETTDPDDGRIRVMRLTERGRQDLLKAIPLWRRAQALVDGELGSTAKDKLNELLDLAVARLAPSA